MSRTALPVELLAEPLTRAVLLSAVLSTLLTAAPGHAQSGKIEVDRAPTAAPPSSRSTSTPGRVDEAKITELASLIGAASTETEADAALAAYPGALGKGLGRALLLEIHRLVNNNAPSERVLNTAMRLRRYSKRPEMEAERGIAYRGSGIANLYSERLDLAEKELLAAAGMFRRAGASGRQDLVWTIRDLSTLYHRRQDFPRAVEYYEKLRSAADAIGDRDSVAYAGNGLATLYFQSGDLPKAYQHLETSLIAAQKIEDKDLKLTTLGRLALAFMNQGRIGKAAEVYDIAYRTAVESGSPASANYLYQSAVAQIKLGDLTAAYSRFRRVLAESDSGSGRRLYIYSLLNVAWIHKQHAQEKKAVELYERTVSLADTELATAQDATRRVYGSIKAEAINKLAEIRFERGDPQGAYNLYLQNLKLLHSVRQAGETPSRIRQGGPDPNGLLEIEINRRLGELQNSLGNTTEGTAHFSEAIQLAQKLGYEAGSIDTLLSMAVQAANLGEPQKALTHVSAVQLIVQKEGRLDQLLKLRTITAKIMRKLNRPAAADLAFQEAIRISESLRTDVLMPDQRAAYFSSLFEPFDEYIGFLMERHAKEPDAGFDGKAFNVSERRRARALLDSLKTARADIRHGVDAALLEQENRIRDQLNSVAREQFSTIDSQFKPAIDIDRLERPALAPKSDITFLTTELARVETAIRKQSPRYAELMQPRPLRWNAIQTLLDDKTILLNYTLEAKRSFLWTITQDRITSFVLPPRDEIETLAKTVYAEISDVSAAGDRGSFSPAAEALSRILLKPAIEAIGNRKIVVVGDGALQYIPFSSLPDPRTGGTAKAPMLFSNEIQFAPSASVVAVLRQEAERRPPPGKSIAIFADPVFSADDERFEGAAPEPLASTRALEGLVTRDLFDARLLSRAGTSGSYEIPRLPFSRREAEAIFSNALSGPSFKALDFEASREKIAGIDLSKYGIVHFATHGILHSEYPELSGVVLSLFNEKGEPVNGFLRLNEIYNMKLNADLVVLSACQTALGKEVRGEGLIGLTRGFMYAGSPRILASLWKVDDVATADLMRLFYQKMLKENMRPSAALRAAKIEMIGQKRWSAPYFWAAFELQGEWR